MMTKLCSWVVARVGSEDTERGATAVEYAILVSLIAAVIAGTVGVLGGQVNQLFDAIVDAF